MNSIDRRRKTLPPAVYLVALGTLLLGLGACSDPGAAPTGPDGDDPTRVAAPSLLSTSTGQTATMKINEASPFGAFDVQGKECFDFDAGSVLTVVDDFEVISCEFAFTFDRHPKELRYEAYVVHNSGQGVTVATTSEPFADVYLDDLSAITFSSPLNIRFNTTVLFRTDGGDVYKIAPVSETSTDVTFLWAPVVARPYVPVEVDIKPGSDPNSFALDDRGLLPVAVLTTGDFDAADVAPATVTLGDLNGSDVSVARRPNGTLRASLEDVDLDSDLDLVLHFDLETLVAGGDLGTGTDELFLAGETAGGTPIRGSDAVNVVRQ